MALVQLRKSDYSGVEMPEKTGARVRVMFYDPERPDRRADLTDEEVDQLLPFVKEVETRRSRRKAEKED
jgi:hypothetical protein